MTTYIQFTPTDSSPPFQFIATMSGTEYNVSVTWNIFGECWYVNIYDLNGDRLKTQPLVGSPIGTDIKIAPVLFGSSGTLVYREPSNNFEVS